MIDLKLLEKDFDSVATKLKKKKVDEELLSSLKELFKELKEKKAIQEELQATQNAKSKLFPVYKKEGKDISELKKELEENKTRIAQATQLVREVEDKLTAIAMAVPNLPDESVPEG